MDRIKAAIVAFTRAGALLALGIARAFNVRAVNARVFAPEGWAGAEVLSGTVFD